MPSGLPLSSLVTWAWASLRSAGWAPALVFTAHVVLAYGFGAYAAWPRLDLPMHVAGGAAMAHFAWRVVTHGEAVRWLGRLTRCGAVVLAFSLTCTITIVWEFAEWTSDRLGWTHAQLGLEDTLLDMLLGMLGGLGLLAVHGWRSRTEAEDV